MASNITITPGFDPQEREEVARLYWQAFAAKLGRVMRPEARAIAFIEAGLDPQFALSARDPAGRLLGVAGFKTAHGGLLAGGLPDMMRHYGAWGGLWRGLLLSVLERDTEDGVLQMDGIFVSSKARGQGAGGALLDAITAEARAQGCTRVRLDVIDTNPRAQALYERKGFVATGREDTGPFRWLFGFRSATRMERPV
ncbi:GNAT family N-acetyltransferase [Rhodalgimonas zhirmunskyi]|uniref:GNAT family N-acetyltransferase n=1 Tax=Rhodalgimonas zhirmunskyi TaxID=2964767 RepID=A0AAJ1X4I5_9RHOB|nr:GNAT family N-acetyltransferase [Rhodoalgimonas zhirmunskyi]MDQ2093546.1 GNAT family N-acetyltransferase [Rhodoalgimonas zhirmunskyi]